MFEEYTKGVLIPCTKIIEEDKKLVVCGTVVREVIGDKVGVSTYFCKDCLYIKYIPEEEVI
jgi:hypothetical protein